MKKRNFGWIFAVSCIVGLVALGTPTTAEAQQTPGSFGIGVGAATGASGISFKTSLGGQSSLQGVLGTWGGWFGHWRYGENNVAAAADYLMEMPTIASGQAVNLHWNYGVGGGLGVGEFSGVALGASGVLGLVFDFSPTAIPLDAVVEYRPGFYITDDFRFAPVNFTGHIRLWF